MKLTLCFKLLFLFPFLAFSQGQIKFECLEYHLLPVTIGQTSTLKIPFSNTGNEPLTLTKCQSTNTSSYISYNQKQILPNQSDTLEVKILNNSLGNFNHSFLLAINNQENLTRIKVNIDVLGNQVFGTVVQKNSGDPLAFVKVSIDKSEIGTTTDLEGKYTLKASLNDTLVFTLAGMKTQKIKIEKENIPVQLEEIELIEVVEPPIFPKKTADYSTKKVAQKELKKAKK